jgi:ribonuclease E
MLPRPSTSQVTLSINTGDAFSVSPAPNSTFVSPPSFDGSTTLEMSTAGVSSEGAPFAPASAPPPQGFPATLADRTEMLGEVTPPAPRDSVATRTQVPLPELARPTSVTPPPVVDMGRQAAKAAPRALGVGRAFGLGAAALSVLLVAGVVVRRGRSSAVSQAAPVSATQPARVSSSVPQQPSLPAPPGDSLVAASAPVAASASAPAAATGSAAAVASATLPAAPDAKRLALAASAPHAKAAPTASGLFLRAISMHPPATPAKARAAEPPMPASGL